MSVEANPEAPAQAVAGTNKAKVTKNVASTLITQIISWTITFVVTFYVPRYLGPVRLGQMTTATSFLMVFSVVAPWGINTVLVKEIARYPARLGEFVTNALVLRLTLASMMGLIALTVAHFIGYPLQIMGLLVLGVITLLFVNVNDVFTSALAGQERLGRQNIVSLVDKVLSSGIVLLFVVLRAPVVAFGLPGCVSGVVQLCMHLSQWHKGQGSLLKATRPSLDTLRFLVRAGLPYLGQTAFITLYGQTDPLVLSFVTNYTTVAWYNVAWRLVGTTMFLPVAIGGALLPTLTRLYHANDTEGFARLSRRALEIALVIGVPVATVMLLVPDRVIHLMYTKDYDGSIAVLRVGGICCLLYYITIVLSTIVNAIERQKEMVKSTILVTVLGVPFCFLFSWTAYHQLHNGAIGAVISDALLETILFVALVRLLPRHLFDAATYWRIARFALAAIPMSLFLYFTQYFHAAGLWVFLPAAALYVIGLFVLRAIDKTYIDVFKDLLKKKAS